MFSTAANDETKTSDAKKAASANTVDSSSTRPPEEITSAQAVKAEAVAEIAKDDSPNEEQVEQYLEQQQEQHQEQQEEDADYEELPPLPPLEEKKIDLSDL